MTSFEALDKEKKTRASLHRDVLSLCNEACHSLGMDITKSAVDLVIDVLMHKLTAYADDLEKFAKHAKRSVVNSDDCRLLTRRNSTLTARLNSIKLPASATKEKRRRTVAAPVSSTNSSPAKRPRDERPVKEGRKGDEPAENADDAIDLTFD